MRRIFAAMVITVAAGVVLLALPSRGAVRGRVVDSEGAPVPGATVKIGSPALRQESAVTGPDGSFRIDALPTGRYTVEIAHDGFKPTNLGGIRVLPGGTTRLNIWLERMEGGAPIVDPTDTGTGNRITYEELVKTPTARDPWAVLDLVPGVDTSPSGATGRQPMFVGQGANGANAVWAVDGVAVTDRAALGASPTYYDFGAIEDVQVTTAGFDAPLMSGGPVDIAIVTKRGANEFHGTGRISFAKGHPLNGTTVSGAAGATGTQGLSATTDGRTITVPGAQPSTATVAEPDWPITVFLTSTGRSSGAAFEMTILNESPRPLTFRADAVFLEPVAGITKAAIAYEIAQHPNAGRVTTTLNAYCLDYPKPPPEPEMVFRFADTSSPNPYSVRLIFDATRRLRDAGKLAPDVGDAGSYFDATRQWSIWTLGEGFDQRRFTEAFVQHGRKNIEASGQHWDKDTEKAFRQLAPARWRVQQMLRQEMQRESSVVR